MKKTNPIYNSESILKTYLENITIIFTNLWNSEVGKTIIDVDNISFCA